MGMNSRRKHIVTTTFGGCVEVEQMVGVSTFLWYYIISIMEKSPLDERHINAWAKFAY